MNKYHKGERIPSMEALVAEIIANRAVYMRDKVQNAAWLQNMNLRTLRLFVDGGSMWYAVANAGNDDCEACGGNGNIDGGPCPWWERSK